MTTPSDLDGPAVDAAPFERVPAPLRTALTGRGFTDLTEVQTAVLEADGARHDLRMSSQTGSGKTVAIGFALAERLLEPAPGRRGPTALVIVPTRELADQVRNELDWLFANVAGVKTDCVTGGTSIVAERRRLARSPRILVATPGRLLDHIRNKGVDCSDVNQLVLDEADQMLDMGFRDDLDAILASLSPERRTHMVSATFPREVTEFVDRYQTEPVAVEGTRLGAANVDIEHIACLLPDKQRYDALVNLLLMTGDERTLVFVRTRQDTGTLAERLAEDGFSALPLSGDLPQAQRTRTLNAFRRGMVNTLVATDVAARGLDVPEVSQVIQFDLPLDGSVYTHRSGRTGRAGRKGRCVLLVGDRARHRANRLFSEARVVTSWRDAPSADVVQREIDGRAAARLEAALDAGAPVSEAALATAQRLLETRTPAALVAQLLAMAQPVPICAPRALHSAPQRTPLRERTTLRERAPLRTTGTEPRRASSYTRFSINWGAQAGADPRRVLAHVCRRGGITGDRIGSIEVLGRTATFEVDSSVVDSFANRIQTPDRRDPHLHIRRVGHGQSRD